MTNPDLTPTMDMEAYPFLKGTGEMAERTRSFDWTKTPLGHPGTWPASLQTTVSIILHSKFPMFLLWGEDYIQFYNDAFVPSFGSGNKYLEALGQPVQHYWKEAWPVLGPLVDQVRLSGEAIWKEDQPLPIDRNGQVELTYWTFSYSPVMNEQGLVAGVLSTCMETTDKVNNLAQLQINTDELTFAIEANELGTFDLNPTTGKFTANNRLKGWFGVKPEDEVPLDSALLVIAPQDRQRVTKAIERAMQYESGGRYEEIYTIIHPHTQQSRIVLAKGRAWFGPEQQAYRLNGTLQDITQHALSSRATEESELRFRSLIDEAPVATCLFVGPDMIVELANDVMLSYWGKDDSILGLPLGEAMPELAGQPFLGILKEVFTSGKPHSEVAAEAQLVVDGKLSTYYFNYTYKPLRDSNGEVYAIMDMAVDVTAEVLARRKAEDTQTSLRSAIELAELATWSIDVVNQKIFYSERLQEWLGVTGAVLEIGASPRIHPKDQDRVGKAMKQAMQPGGSGYFNEVYSIVHAATGQERIIHTNGIARFDEQGKAVAISGTSQDVTLQQELQMALKTQVLQRTEQLEGLNESLRRSNDELSQYAYVASHDLQEPLRKIRVFSDLLARQQELSANSRQYIDRISGSAARMTQLIKDLLDFSTLTNSEQPASPVDLNGIVQDVERDFELLIAEKKAVLTIAPLPTVPAIKLQMNQLFYNIIGNALKFTREQVVPHIGITYGEAADEEVKQYIRKPSPGIYYKISIKDNGIGFDAQYSDHIFEVFKRLHGRDSYAGSGIGLALCRRITINHGGYLYSESQVGQGTTFHILLPGNLL